MARFIGRKVAIIMISDRFDLRAVQVGMNTLCVGSETPVYGVGEGHLLHTIRLHLSR
jgi:hypothetical protein